MAPTGARYNAGMNEPNPNQWPKSREYPSIPPDQATADKLLREADLAAIREGIADMNAGRVMPLEQLDARIRAKLGF